MRMNEDDTKYERPSWIVSMRLCFTYNAKYKIKDIIDDSRWTKII